MSRSLLVFVCFVVVSVVVFCGPRLGLYVVCIRECACVCAFVYDTLFSVLKKSRGRIHDWNGIIIITAHNRNHSSNTMSAVFLIASCTSEVITKFVSHHCICWFITVGQRIIIAERICMCRRDATTSSILFLSHLTIIPMRIIIGCVCHIFTRVHCMIVIFLLHFTSNELLFLENCYSIVKGYENDVFDCYCLVYLLNYICIW